MNLLTLLLAPLAFIFGTITYLRNKLYDFNVLTSYKIPLKSIVVGNLSVGGTGKTPHVFYVTDLLSKRFKTAILSRGYGRITNGFHKVSINSKAIEVGDEPLLLKRRLGEKVFVSVCEDRKAGVEKIISDYEPNLIVLDDAFQHRKITAGVNILLTEFKRPYFSDFPMPMGRLREFTGGKKRGDLFLVTKCPSNLTENQKIDFISKMGVEINSVFFSKIKYAPFQCFSSIQIDNIQNVLLVTAIADDSLIVEHLSDSFSVKTFKFRDHHAFTREDIKKIHLKFELLPAANSIILTTEKDFVKLSEFDEVINGKYPWYFLPIDIEIDREEDFNQILINYVGSI